MPTIAGMLRSTAGRVPDAPALTFEDTEYSYLELDHAVDRYAAALLEVGVARGDRVALMSTNSDLFVLTFYAVLRLGAILVPVNPGSAPPEVAHLVNDSGADILIFAPALADKVAPEGVLPEGLRTALALGECEGFPDLTALVAATVPVLEPTADETVREDDDALILYTSGTTGQPKGALFDHHRAACVATSMVGTLGMRAGDRFLHVAPLYHAAEMGIMLIPGTLLGAKHVILPGFDPLRVLQTMAEEQITMFFGVPTMYQLMMRALPDANTGDLPAWRTGLFGAAPMPAHAVRQLVATWPGVAFMQLCGQTEGGPTGIYSTHEQVLERPDASGRQGVVLTEARVVGLDGRAASPGETGELQLRAESVMKGYWNNPEATAAAFDGDWLRTGDVARVDSDGYLTLVDRLKDMIISGGRNVYSLEVENALASHPDVLDVAVIARPHPDFGESIVAVVTPRDGAVVTLSDVQAHCRDLIADYKIPHDLVVSGIPRNTSGKVLKNRLREQVVGSTLV
jgi:acyl-CoA synthetase (AMP-forming)/AMP-acid ligase II